MTCSANSPSEFEKIVTNLLRPPFGLKATPDLKKNDAEAKDGAPPEAASVVCPREGLKFRIEPIIRCHDKPLNRLEVIRITGNVVKLFNGNEYIAMADECSVAHQASNLLHQSATRWTTRSTIAQETFGQTPRRFLMPQDLPLIHYPPRSPLPLDCNRCPPRPCLLDCQMVAHERRHRRPYNALLSPRQTSASEPRGPLRDILQMIDLKSLGDPDFCSRSRRLFFNSGLWDLVFLSNRKDYQINQNRTQGIMSKLKVTAHKLLLKSEFELHLNRIKKFLNTPASFSSMSLFML
ncbi:hypothetical protein PGT21_009583 [Puccinia graminis f. sp. tritici]|uniref:Uncharacterized protein n=1 Tax=Puccinia graminis f. sp. tritici TaxID=56615 RepID=A0A5B0M323_PUCGR|nr:hypothetical protein PGT21_009583 [Puccinia graminis f. sp. tritici]